MCAQVCRLMQRFERQRCYATVRRYAKDGEARVSATVAYAAAHIRRRVLYFAAI